MPKPEVSASHLVAKSPATDTIFCYFTRHRNRKLDFLVEQSRPEPADTWDAQIAGDTEHTWVEKCARKPRFSGHHLQTLRGSSVHTHTFWRRNTSRQPSPSSKQTASRPARGPGDTHSLWPSSSHMAELIGTWSLAGNGIGQRTGQGDPQHAGASVCGWDDVLASAKCSDTTAKPDEQAASRHTWHIHTQAKKLQLVTHKPAEPRIH